jgi:hypothetical protein
VSERRNVENETVLTELQAEMRRLLEEAERELSSIKRTVAECEWLGDKAPEAPAEPLHSQAPAAPKARAPKPPLSQRLANRKAS